MDNVRTLAALGAARDDRVENVIRLAERSAGYSPGARTSHLCFVSDWLESGVKGGGRLKFALSVKTKVTKLIPATWSGREHFDFVTGPARVRDRGGFGDGRILRIEVLPSSWEDLRVAMGVNTMGASTREFDLSPLAAQVGRRVRKVPFSRLVVVREVAFRGRRF